MSPIGHQAILRLRDDRVVAPSPAARRTMARVILRAGRAFGLVAFRGADTHVHNALLCKEAAAREFGRRVEIALVRSLRLEVGFNPVHVRPIHDHGHLRTLFGYILEQDRHHGIGVDPFHDAGNLPDLLGLRLLGRYTIRSVREQLPRVTRADLLRHLGVDELPELPTHWEGLADAGAAAAGLPALTGRSAEVVTARRAAIHAVRRHLSGTETARLLGLTERAVTRLRGEACDADLVDAVRRQAALRAAVRVPLDFEVPLVVRELTLVPRYETG